MPNKSLGNKDFERDTARIRVFMWHKNAVPAATKNLLNRIIRFPTNSDEVTLYAKTGTGLTTACSEASAYDTIWIPTGTYNLSGTTLTVPGTVVLMGQDRVHPVIQGALIMSDLSEIQNLDIQNTTESASSIYGVEGSISGTSRIYYCTIAAANSGSGNAYAVSAKNGTGSNQGDLYVYHSNIEGNSTGGNGYAGQSTAGRLYIFHCRANGSTDRFTTS